MLPIDCKISFILTWSVNFVSNFLICEADRTAAFTITDTKFYVHVATLSAQDNINLLQQLNQVKNLLYQSKVSIQAQSQ